MSNHDRVAFFLLKRVVRACKEFDLLADGDRVAVAVSGGKDSFLCSWNRRKTLFDATVGLGCNKLAFGHNADDAAATTLLNLLFNGRLETMVPCVEFFDGVVTVIRPLIYLPEKELARYGQAAGFPDPPLCSQGLGSRRVQIRGLLRQFGRDQNQIRANLWRAARRAMGF
jgi:tRNA(Ile)-lysidine synthase TilS/MesJ